MDETVIEPSIVNVPVLTLPSIVISGTNVCSIIVESVRAMVNPDTGATVMDSVACRLVYAGVGTVVYGSVVFV
jgi:hypothetical protein